jgi:DNA-binding MarR family transcriptional regulator
MQVSRTESAVNVDAAVRDVLRDRRGISAWQAFLRAHATLMRELGTDLAAKARLSLGDFDVLAQLTVAGGELRVTDLAARVFSSRSALTRRLDRMVDEGLVRRSRSDADGRGVVVGVTDVGAEKLLEALPIHLDGVAKLFVEPLDDEELATLEQALTKVTTDCSFG